MSSIFCALRDMLLDELWYTFWGLPFEIRQQSSSWDIESSFSSKFLEVRHDASVFDPFISAVDWFIGCFSSVSTLDIGAYFLS